MFQVRNDRLFKDGQPVRFVKAHDRNFSWRRIEPTLEVVHDTAGRLKKFSSVSWFQNGKARASAHLVVETDGTVTQMVDFDRVAYHAGKSKWKGRKGCNRFAVGIEIVSPGKLTSRGKYAVAWFGQRWLKSELVEDNSSKWHGKGWWLPYTDEQIEVVNGITEALAKAYPSISDVQGHYHISPWRKVDVGPHWPLGSTQDVLASVRQSRGRRKFVDEDTVLAGQTRLKELGYQVGGLDGDMGPNTRAGIRKFQEQNSIKVTGLFDGTTLRILYSADAKEAPLGTRLDLTTQEVRAQGSKTILSADAAQVVTAGGAVAAVSERLAQSTETLDQIESGKTLVERGTALLDWLLTPAGIKSLIILAVLGAAFYALAWIKRWRTEDARTFKHVGR